jgi:hypothetical protein
MGSIIPGGLVWEDPRGYHARFGLVSGIHMVSTFQVWFSFRDPYGFYILGLVWFLRIHVVSTGFSYSSSQLCILSKAVSEPTNR